MSNLHSIQKCNSDEVDYIGQKLFEYNTEIIPS